MTAKRIRSLRLFLFPYWPVRVLFFLFLLLNVQAGEIAHQENCFAICVSRCFNSSRGLLICGRKCDDYRNENLCKTDSCWKKCNDLLSDDDLKDDLPRLDAPFNLSAVYNQDSNIDLSWSTDINETVIYAVQFKRQSENHWHTADQLLSEEPSLRNFSMNKADICEELVFRVSAISSLNGFGRFSEPYSIPATEPIISSELKLLNLQFRPVPFHDPNSSSSNGTLSISLGYNITGWPLTDKDLEVIPLFHVVKCVINYDNAIANPIFYKSDVPGAIEAQFSADFMYHRCTVFYFVNEVRSKQCNRSFKPGKSHNLGAEGGVHPIEISCETVTNSGCAKSNEEKYPRPDCGFSSNFQYKLIDEENIDWSNPNTNISVNITFTPLPRKLKPLYHVGFVGEALSYANPQEELLAGVNIKKIESNSSSCEVLKNGKCLKKHDNSFVLTNLKMDKLYGVVICGILDPRNLNYPPMTNTHQGFSPRSEKLFVSSEIYKTGTSLLVYVLICTIILGLILTLIICFCYCFQKKQNENKKLLEELQNGNTRPHNSYTDLPKVHDLWELERRNLIIYDDKKLGSGAFGAVYLGKLIGQAKGSKDAQSTLGVNLMRAENCEVAVKMLPQYADELCKSEFLREIALMKTLGYHERLVNMLACITDSEPFCLIVEYCSDGDLLQFLRKRCKYMLELDAKQINYSDPDCDAEFDQDMVMTIKQLLMFAVQISFGLEYLSQKGFVHRDVAARNVLVHDKHYAKIGDFGLCRYIYADQGNYKSRGGRLPVKWLAPESIRSYDFTTKSDVWSFGVCLFEIITLGGSPYPGIQVEDMLKFLDAGNRMEKPDNCPDEFYEIMQDCWSEVPEKRPSFFDVRKKLAFQLETITDEYSYLKLDAQKEYYTLSASTGLSSNQQSFSFDHQSLQPTLSDDSTHSPDSGAALIKP